MAKKVYTLNNFLIVQDTDTGKKQRFIKFWVFPLFLEDKVELYPFAKGGFEYDKVEIFYTDFIDDTDTAITTEDGIETYLSDKIG